jgi:hypothetical protein
MDVRSYLGDRGCEALRPATISFGKSHVSFEALLTFFGILAAVLALARPVQRHSIDLFAPPWRIAAALLISFVLIVCRDAPFGVPPPFGWPPEPVLFTLTLAAFLVPVLTALWCWASWHRAKLTPKRMGKIESLFRSALTQHEFDEVDRIVRTNRKRLNGLPRGAASALFSPAMVTAFAETGSFVHLELLADLKLFASLENPHGAVGAVVRELLHSEASPLRFAVVNKYGGLEHSVYSDEQRSLIEKTFENPEWYYHTSAHYPLIISAIESLRSGKFDVEYNGSGRDYEATQGTSRRSSCPIYISVGAEFLALEAALEQRVDHDYYSTDLFQIFDAIQERSKFHTSVWEDPRNNHEFPTPFAYLLYMIASDLEDLVTTAIRQAISGPEGGAALPGDVAEQIVRSWSVCVWSIADSSGQVSTQFRRSIIRRYLMFMLQLRWGLSEIYPGPIPDDLNGLDTWRDFLLMKLKSMFHQSDHVRWSALMEAIESLDKGKGYVIDGYDWLTESLAD